VDYPTGSLPADAVLRRRGAGGQEPKNR
jgi:hypothetical protein